MLLLTKKDIKSVFSMRDAIEADKEAFRVFSRGACEVPLRTQIPAPQENGCFLFMPAFSEELGNASLKVVNIFPENAKKGLPTAPAQVLLIDGNTGMIRAILDGTYVTQLRTGAASGVAFDLLARKEAKIGALIGVGSQAAEQLIAMITVRNLEEVRVFARNYEKTKEFAEKMQLELEATGTKIIPTKTSDEAISNADMIITVTPSTSPVFDGSKVKAGATISCVGSYQPQMQELDPVVLARANKIYFDSVDAVLSESGDILIPLADGTITKDDFTGDIGEVLLGEVKGRELEEEIIVFKSVGIGTQDLVTARYIYDKAIARGIGMKWE
ncbi:ornithine cyclodeaminase family protein [Lachnospiraceae bacterium LCP25S3_G4]